MSNEIIERVVKAIGGLWNDRCNPCTDAKIVKCEDCLNAAKAVIAAMREPTDKMLEAVKLDEGAKGIYQDMIDEALKD